MSRRHTPSWTIRNLWMAILLLAAPPVWAQSPMAPDHRPEGRPSYRAALDLPQIQGLGGKKNDKNAADVPKPEKSATWNTQTSEIARFAGMWFLFLTSGGVIWYLWLRRRPWGRPPPPHKPEEDAAEIDVDATPEMRNHPLRDELVLLIQEWQERYGISPIHLDVLASLDAASLVGMPDDEYAAQCRERPRHLARTVDFRFKRNRYLVKACRQSGDPGGHVRTAPKAHHLEWDLIVFILYDPQYAIIGAWQMSHEAYLAHCDPKERLTPEDYQKGELIYNGLVYLA